MSDSSTKTKAQLLDEVRKLRERVDKLESTASERQHAVELLWDSESLDLEKGSARVQLRRQPAGTRSLRDSVDK